ncbi:hypothetical protein CIK05_09000 [Bdellovibrio sp. qaytius]|nr:hypothetical protein CIK05_09000 [Bdellovibrio sp. qaytius]
MTQLRFESTVNASIDQVWQSITSLQGLTSEMMPLMRLTAPKGFKNLSDIYPRQKDIKSYVLLFGVFPIDTTDLHLKSLTVHKGFIEESNMASMNYWRHERKLTQLSASQVSIVDELTFEPRRFTKISVYIIKKFFEHRHKNLKKLFEESAHDQ